MCLLVKEPGVCINASQIFFDCRRSSVDMHIPAPFYYKYTHNDVGSTLSLIQNDIIDALSNNESNFYCINATNHVHTFVIGQCEYDKNTPNCESQCNITGVPEIKIGSINLIHREGMHKSLILLFIGVRQFIVLY